MRRLTSIIERLREKPKEMRVQVAFLSALCFTGVIGLLWGVTLPTRLQALSQRGEEQAKGESGLDSFFTEARSNFGQLIGATQEAPGSEEELVGNTPPASETYKAGTPESDFNEYNNSFLNKEEPGVTPVGRREVRISTSTSEARD